MTEKLTGTQKESSKESTSKESTSKGEADGNKKEEIKSGTQSSGETGKPLGPTGGQNR